MAKHKAETRKDRLRIGTPLWVRTPHSTVDAATQLVRDRYDVIVVGAGISGALMAEALTRDGRSVLVLDRRAPVRGSTPASTAMIQHEIDVPLTRLRRKVGADRADRAWLRSAASVEALETLVTKLQIDCQMRPRPVLYLAGDETGARGLAAEAQARQDIGIAAAYLNRADLVDGFGMERDGAILSQASASANPAQLAAGLLRVAMSRGARVVSPIEITDMAELSSGIALATAKGEVLVADHAVFCTGYEYLAQMKSAFHRVTSTWALASEPMAGLPGWLRDVMVWEASDPYLYFRTDEAGRVIAGGEDENTSDSSSDPGKLSSKTKVIARKLEALTGVSIGKPAYRWSAPFSVTRDGLPIIDRVPGFDRVFTVMGFGGNGITFSMIGAEIVSALIAGRSDPDADLFHFR